MKDSRLRIIVTGLVGMYPVGGVAWDYLQYAIGLSRLGHDVYYHEDTCCWPYHPLEARNTSESDYSVRFLRDFFDRHAPQLQGRWHYVHLYETSHGMERRAFEEIARGADLFINVSGACLLPDSLSAGCTRVFLDTDPGYNQIVLSEKPAWSENAEQWCTSVKDHDRHFTYAENIHGPDCSIPTLGFDWKPTRMPVVMDLWQGLISQAPSNTGLWTTVMTWNAFKGPLIYKGTEYKSKGAEFEKIAELPRHVNVPLKVAVGGVGAPLERLSENGWNVVDGPATSLTPGSYQEFIGSSRGEISTAKHVYVAMRSGWFSCRSACYLAAGRPVVVQDTGFSRVIPVGEGIVAFTNLAEAVEAIKEVESDYSRHAKAARDLAGEYFSSDSVLERLVADATKSYV